MHEMCLCWRLSNIFDVNIRFLQRVVQSATKVHKRYEINNVSEYHEIQWLSTGYKKQSTQNVNENLQNKPFKKNSKLLNCDFKSTFVANCTLEWLAGECLPFIGYFKIQFNFDKQNFLIQCTRECSSPFQYVGGKAKEGAIDE